MHGNVTLDRQVETYWPGYFVNGTFTFEQVFNALCKQILDARSDAILHTFLETHCEQLRRVNLNHHEIVRDLCLDLAYPVEWTKIFDSNVQVKKRACVIKHAMNGLSGVRVDEFLRLLTTNGDIWKFEYINDLLRFLGTVQSFGGRVVDEGDELAVTVEQDNIRTKLNRDLCILALLWIALVDNPPKILTIWILPKTTRSKTGR